LRPSVVGRCTSIICIAANFSNTKGENPPPVALHTDDGPARRLHRASDGHRGFPVSRRYRPPLRPGNQYEIFGTLIICLRIGRRTKARRTRPRYPRRSLFQAKPEIALEQIKAARTAGFASGCGADGCRLWQRYEAANGDQHPLHELCGRDRPQYLGLAAGHGAFASANLARVSGDRPSCFDADEQHQPISVKGARSQPAGRSVAKPLRGREGTADRLCFALSRGRGCGRHNRDTLLTEPRDEEWLVIEWPQGEAEPTKYWFCHFARGYRPSNVWLISQSCDGGSSAIIRS